MDRKYINYLTTNLVNDMIYIGVHLNKKEAPYEFDGYFGSNKELKADVKRLGKENFTRETLFVFDTKNEAKRKEKELVTLEFVAREDTYNKTIGGGDWPIMTGENNPMFRKHWSEEWKKAQSERMSGKNSPNWGKHPSEETRAKRSGSMLKYFATFEGKNMIKKLSVLHSGKNNYWFGKTFSEEHCRKLRENSLAKLTPEVIEQRRLDVKSISKIRGYKTKLAKMWGLVPGGPAVDRFIKKYAPDLDLSFTTVIKQRRLDIQKESKILGWKSKLALLWGVTFNAVTYFIEKYAHDLNTDLDIPFELIIIQRREDIKNISKVWGYKTKLSEKWCISNFAVDYFIKKHASDLV